MVAPASPPALPVQAQQDPIATTTAPTPVLSKEASQPLPIKVIKEAIPSDEAEIRLLIDKYAADLTPEDRAKINAAALCESGYSQFNDDGDPLYSNTADVGALQINSVHLPEAARQGLDIVNKVADNVRFGVGLYRSQGMAPWKSSRACWDKPVPGW